MQFTSFKHQAISLDLAAASAELAQGESASGFVWLSLLRDELESNAELIHSLLKTQAGSGLLDLHLQDLLNPAHPSHYDYTSDYDLIVFRRLVIPREPQSTDGAIAAPLQSSQIGFVIAGRLLITVHPETCDTARQFADRYVSLTANSAGSSEAQRISRLPQSAADLMLRMVNQMVDSYLEMRKHLSMQFERLQIQLLDTNAHFDNWSLLLAGRSKLQALEDLCEEQHDAMQEWLDTLQESASAHPLALRDLLVARTRDVIEHIERVLHHVRRLEQNAETAVQIHFSATANRANNVMRVLTALTAIFLPLNLITGVFGMNFKHIPFADEPNGFWWALVGMLCVAALIVYVFRRKRYLRTRV